MSKLERLIAAIAIVLAGLAVTAVIVGLALCLKPWIVGLIILIILVLVFYKSLDDY